ncbi:MAG TPA: PadR family transcriptional regulator [Chloroflexota bacterium]|nr:PadR family transcriptional regulator [Chloroflexota bacterium]
MPPPGISAATNREPEEARSSSLLRPAALLLLREQDCHGYELMGRLAELGVEVPPTTGGLYRSLRTMSDEGLLTSYWSTPERGPARRVYVITDRGAQCLERCMSALASRVRTERGMLERYGAGARAQRSAGSS